MLDPVTLKKVKAARVTGVGELIFLL